MNPLGAEFICAMKFEFHYAKLMCNWILIMLSRALNVSEWNLFVFHLTMLHVERDGIFILIIDGVWEWTHCIRWSSLWSHKLRSLVKLLHMHFHFWEFYSLWKKKSFSVMTLNFDHIFRKIFRHLRINPIGRGNSSQLSGIWNFYRGRKAFSLVLAPHCNWLPFHFFPFWCTGMNPIGRGCSLQDWHSKFSSPGCSIQSIYHFQFHVCGSAAALLPGWTRMNSIGRGNSSQWTQVFSRTHFGWALDADWFAMPSSVELSGTPGNELHWRRRFIPVIHPIGCDNGEREWTPLDAGIHLSSQKFGFQLTFPCSVEQL